MGTTLKEILAAVDEAEAKLHELAELEAPRAARIAARKELDAAIAAREAFVAGLGPAQVVAKGV